MNQFVSRSCGCVIGVARVLCLPFAVARCRRPGGTSVSAHYLTESGNLGHCSGNSRRWCGIASMPVALSQSVPGIRVGVLSIGRLNEFVCLQEKNKRAINGPEKYPESNLETWRKGLQSGYRPHERVTIAEERGVPNIG